jgi:hypothetical protein
VASERPILSEAALADLDEIWLIVYRSQARPIEIVRVVSGYRDLTLRPPEGAGFSGYVCGNPLR